MTTALPKQPCMDPNDWAAVFRDRPSIAQVDVDRLLAVNQEYFKVLDRYVGRSSRVLEAGCGPAHRMLAYISKIPLHAVFVDRDAEVLAMAARNRDVLGINTVHCERLDFFDLGLHFLPGEFDVACHHGVLEHYEPDEIRAILKTQLKVARQVVFAVPYLSGFNLNFFDDGLYRNLWEPEEWRKVLQGFSIEVFDATHSNKDELVVVLAR